MPQKCWKMEHKDDLIKLLQAVASPRYELSVTSGLMGRGGEGVSVGLPVALIADLLLIELNGAVATDDPVDEPSVLETLEDSSFDPSSSFLGRFAAGLGPMLMAWLISGGSDDGRTDGPEEMVGHLQGFLGDEAEALSRQLDLLSNAPGGAVCIMLGATLIEGHSIVCARDSGAMFLGLIDGDGTKSVLKAWNAALG